jgi:hypothetical protein
MKQSEKKADKEEGSVFLAEHLQQAKTTLPQRADSSGDFRVGAVEGGLKTKALFTIVESPNGSISSREVASSSKSISVWGKSPIGSEVPSSRDDTPDKQVKEVAQTLGEKTSISVDGEGPGVEVERKDEDADVSFEMSSPDSKSASRMQEGEVSLSRQKSKANLNPTFDVEATEDAHGR